MVFTWQIGQKGQVIHYPHTPHQRRAHYILERECASLKRYLAWNLAGIIIQERENYTQNSTWRPSRPKPVLVTMEIVVSEVSPCGMRMAWWRVTLGQIGVGSSRRSSPMMIHIYIPGRHASRVSPRLHSGRGRSSPAQVSLFAVCFRTPSLSLSPQFRESFVWYVLRLDVNVGKIKNNFTGPN